MPGKTKVTTEQYGKDHWSLLAYLETRCVDYGGGVEVRHMRSKHGEWKPSWGTRLQGFFDEPTNKSLRLDDHDDYDCLDDLENAGLIKNNGTGLHPAVEITKKGQKVTALLRKHKSAGGQYAEFVLRDAVCGKHNNKLKGNTK